MVLAEALLLLLLTCIAAGLVGSLTGLGGGVVVVPVLVVLFGFPFVDAVGASLITILVTSTTTGAAYVRDHLSDLRIGMFLEIATVPGALLGAVTTIFLTRSHLDSALLIAFGIILLLTVAWTTRRGVGGTAQHRPPDERSQALGFSGEYFDAHEGRTVAYQAERTNPALATMFGAGVISGMFGIGGGVLKVYGLQQALGLPIKVSTATSNFMIGVTAAAGSSVLLTAGYVNAVVAAPVAIGTALGAYVGSRLLPQLASWWVQLLFAIVVGALGIEVILRGFGIL